MKFILKVVFAVMFGVVLSACGTTSSLKSASPDASGSSKINLSEYDVVYVEDFRNKVVDERFKIAVDTAGRSYADQIASKLEAVGSFETVTRKPVDGKAVIVTGDITDYDNGDVVLRMMVGFKAGNANFNADVLVLDNETNKQLGKIVVDKNSWALGGYLAAS